MLVGYLGPKGSFTHGVASHAFLNDELIPYESLTELLKAFEQEAVGAAVVPVENSIEGSVHETIDYLFHHGDIQTVAEIVYPIQQQLLVAKKDRPIHEIYSHPQALAQGKAFIDRYYPKAKLEMTASTAYAARYVSLHPEKNIAAIAPLSAAHEYQLYVQHKDIQEMAANYTRFWILGKKAEEMPTSLHHTEDKVSLALTLPSNQPGALYKALSTFSWRNINMTKIESRPLKTALGEYFFIIDLLMEKEEWIHFAFEELSAMEIAVKVFGEYPVYTVNEKEIEQ